MNIRFNGGGGGGGGGCSFGIIMRRPRKESLITSY